MLILKPQGKVAARHLQIMLVNTLFTDPLSDKRFDCPFVNPPSGHEWSKDFDAVTAREPMQINPSVRSQRLGQLGDEARATIRDFRIVRFVRSIS